VDPVVDVITHRAGLEIAVEDNQGRGKDDYE
jgi:hypothetical protein